MSREQELEHKLDIEKKRQRERVKVINQQQIAMKEASVKFQVYLAFAPKVPRPRHKERKLCKST